MGSEMCIRDKTSTSGYISGVALRDGRVAVTSTSGYISGVALRDGRVAVTATCGVNSGTDWRNCGGTERAASWSGRSLTSVANDPHYN